MMGCLNNNLEMSSIAGEIYIEAPSVQLVLEKIVNCALLNIYLVFIDIVKNYL